MIKPRRRSWRFEGSPALEDRLLMAAPVLDAVPNASIPALKSLIIPLTATDADGDPLTYTTQSDNVSITSRIVTNTVDLKFSIAGFGDMTFKLLPEFAPNTVSKIRGLVESGFYNGLTFHRVIKDFVNQGGDPLGNGTGGPGFRFDDEFNPQAIFSGTGQLAMANSGPDTNGSQFFITITPQRSLDFKHTIFGQLVRGFDVMNAINQTPTGAGDKPVSPVTITTASIVNNTSDAVLVLQSTAADTAQITVTATDPGNDSDSKAFTASTVADGTNDPPYLGPIESRTVASGQPVSIPLTAVDLEGTPLIYSAELIPASATPAVSVVNNIVNIAANPGFVGDLSLKVGVRQTIGNARVDTQVIKITYKQQELNPQALSPIVLVNTPTTVKIGSFTPVLPYSAANFSATMTREGGSPVAATVVAGNNGSYDVTIQLNEASAATIPYVLTITDGTDNTQSTANGTLRATVDFLTVQYRPISPTVGTRTVNGTVGTVFDVDPNRPASNLSAVITWGDNTTSPGTLVPTGNGNYDINAEHTYAARGEYSVTVTVTATNQDTGSSQGTITVPNSAPVLAAIGPKSVSEGSTLTFTATATDLDDGQTLTYSLAPGAPDGATIDPVTGVFSFKPTVGPVAPQVTVIVTDSDSPSASDSETITISVNGVRPTVIAGPTATLEQGETYSGIGSFTDPGLGSWTATVDYGDGSGVQPLDLLPDKTFSLAHTYLKSGSFTITVRVNDAGLPGDPGIATVAVTVGNITPVVNLGAPVSMNEGSTFARTGSFTDPGDEVWTAAVDYGDGTGTRPITVNPDKTFALSHVYTRPGTFTAIVYVRDSGSPVRSGVGTVQVTVANVAPVVTAGPARTIDMLSNYRGSGSFTDPGVGPWTATVDYGDGSGNQPLVLNTDKTFSLDHAYANPGSYSIRINVVDTGLAGQTVGTTVPVQVVNVIPTINASAFPFVQQFQTATIAGSFSDVGAGSWTATVDYGDGTGIKPLALTDRKGFQLTHAYARAGQFPTTIKVTDQFGGVGVSTFVVNVQPLVDVSISRAFTTTSGGSVRGLTLLFSGEVDARSASNAARYAFVRAGADRKFGTADDVVVGTFRSARVLRDIVLLTPRGRVPQGANVRLRVTNVLDTYGRQLGKTTNNSVLGVIKRGGIIEFPA